MTKEFILVIDAGTTSTKAFVFNRMFDIVSQDGIDLNLYADSDNFVEQDGEEIFVKSVRACRNALAKAGITGKDVACLGITNQRGTNLAWDAHTGMPLCRCISWQDTRAAVYTQKIENDGWCDKLRDHMILPGGNLSILDLHWLLQNNDAIRSCRHGGMMFGTIDTWLIYRLTGGRKYVVSTTNVSMWHGYDFKRMGWDEEYLRYLNIDSSILPCVTDDCGDFGVTLASLFGAEIPITGSMADQQSANFAHRVLQKGMAKCTCGTGAFVDICVGDRFAAAPDGMFPIAACVRGEKTAFLSEACIKTAGAVFKWLRDDAQMIRDYSEIESAAASVKDAGGVLFIPALTGLGAPYWNGGACGTLTGLDRSSGKGQIVRAMLEGIAFRIYEVSEILRSAYGNDMPILRMDGGLSRSDVFCQSVADVCGIIVKRPFQPEATALGVAEIAALYMGLTSEDELDMLADCCHQFEPDAARQARLREAYDTWRRLLPV